MRQKIFNAFAAASGRYPWVVIVLASVMTVISFLLAINFIKVETRILDLVPSDEPAAIEFDNILRQYSSASRL